MAISRKLFVNLAVRDLPRARAFFEALGFAFNPQFSDDTAACMVLSEDGYVMLLTEPKFKQFTTRPLCDAREASEALFALSCTSRAEVDALADKAVALGGRTAMPPVDLGFMYGRSFHDLDGHHWEVLWMDPAAVAPHA